MMWLFGDMVNRLYGYLIIVCRMSDIGCPVFNVISNDPDFRRERRNLIFISDFQFFRRYGVY